MIPVPAVWIYCFRILMLQANMKLRFYWRIPHYQNDRVPAQVKHAVDCRFHAMLVSTVLGFILNSTLA